MKGLVLRVGDRVICGAMAKGTVGVMISNKDETDKQRLFFSGASEDGMTFPIWHRQTLQVGDALSVSYEEIDEADVAMPIDIRNVNDKESENRAILENYYRLKAKLEKEGRL
jgi:hypothetical protein